MTTGLEGLGGGLDRKEVCKTPDALAEVVTMDMFKGPVGDKLKKCQLDLAGFRRNEAAATWCRLSCAQRTIPANFKRTFIDGCVATCGGKKPENDPMDYKHFELEAMMDALEEVKAVKKDDDKLSAGASRYLALTPSLDQNRKPVEGMTFVSVNAPNVHADLRLIEEAKIRFPSLAREFEPLERSLRSLLCADPTAAAQYAVRDQKANSSTAHALGYAGKLGAVILLGGAAILSGIMSLVNKKFSIAPFLYAGVLMYILNPDFLTGKDKRQITESAALLNNDNFVYTLAPKYCMKGKEWGDTFESLFELQNKNSPLIDTYLTSPSSEEALNALLDELAPGDKDNTHRKNVKKLLCSTEDFKLLLKMTKEIKSKDVKDLCAGYVREGAWTYARTKAARTRDIFDAKKARQQDGGINTTGLDGLGGGLQS
jgi:hypothetical protein